jgi:hypothetical protein
MQNYSSISPQPPARCRTLPDARLCRLAEQIYVLGEYPLAHLFAELAAGVPLKKTLEAYARLALLGFFIRTSDGVPSLRLLNGTSR